MAHRLSGFIGPSSPIWCRTRLAPDQWVPVIRQAIGGEALAGFTLIIKAQELSSATLSATTNTATIQALRTRQAGEIRQDRATSSSMIKASIEAD
jgi:hypothetical protein